MPRPDTSDYYGSLPLYYSIELNDAPMIKKQFKEGKGYFSLRNYKYETIFHKAAKHNAVDALKATIGKAIFIKELLRKDYEGNTPIHSAAKAGSVDALEFLLSAATRGFTEMQNDFGLTPYQLADQKHRLMQKAVHDGDAIINTRDDLGAGKGLHFMEKLERIAECMKMLDDYQNFVRAETWNARFDVTLEMFLDQVADINLRIFMGMPKPNDLQPRSKRPNLNI